MKLHLFSLFSFPFLSSFEFRFSDSLVLALSRHALWPAALGYGWVPSFKLNNTKNQEKKIPLTLLCSKITRSKKKVQQNIEIAFKFK